MTEFILISDNCNQFKKTLNVGQDVRTADESKEHIEQFHENINKAIKITKTQNTKAGEHMVITNTQFKL